VLRNGSGDDFCYEVPLGIQPNFKMNNFLLESTTEQNPANDNQSIAFRFIVICLLEIMFLVKKSFLPVPSDCFGRRASSRAMTTWLCGSGGRGAGAPRLLTGCSPVFRDEFRT
jgi:hypothetical protein